MRLILSAALWVLPAAAQVDQQRAAGYFREAGALCEREAGRLWGISLCGPMVIADAASKTIATSQPAPSAPPPAFLGYANTAIEWGDRRWSTYVWQMIPQDEHQRGRLLMHELFHRIQPQIGLLARDGPNDHLDTLEGRYWLQLEWRALAKALGAAGADRTTAVRDALAFRTERRRLFPQAAENERLLEMNEGLAQYTGAVAATATTAEAIADTIRELADVTRNATFVRTFAYPLGAAYGLLLDTWSPGWTRRLRPEDDLGSLLMTAAKFEPASNAAAAADRYGATELRAAETKRDAEQQARITALRKRFVEGPVLVIPRVNGASFTTNGITPIPGAGTVYPTYRSSSDWGKLVAEQALVSPAGTVTVPAPAKTDGVNLKGDGWTLDLAPGWTLKPGSRPGDFEIAKQ